MNKQYMVLGLKDTPESDPNTEADNPYLFNHLPRAIQVAQNIAKDDYFGYSRIVELKDVVIFSGGDFISKKNQD